MKELVASHVEYLQWSVHAETSNSKLSPQNMGSNKYANKMVTSHHGTAHSIKNET
jgi:hypothetical protein